MIKNSVARAPGTDILSLAPPYFRLARKVVCSTMATYNKWLFIIFSISVQTKSGTGAACTQRKPLLCLVTSFIRAAGDR